MIEVPERVMSFVMDRKNMCDSGGPCFGYSDPCGQECYKVSNIVHDEFRSALPVTKAKNLTIHFRQVGGLQLMRSLL